MATVGKVHEITREIEWKIYDFFSLSEDGGTEYYSPSFLFAGESWNLCICSEFQSEKNSLKYIGVYLFRHASGPPISLEYSFWLKTCVGKKDKQEQLTCIFGTDRYEGYGTPTFLKRSQLSKKKSEFVPSGILTIVCTLKYSKSTDAADKSATAECCYCADKFVAIDLSSHEKKCLKKTVSCPTCNNDLELSEWFDHECQMARIKATGKLVEDFAGILKSQEHSDVTVKVQDEEFHLHRSILSGRNPYFQSMFTSEMKEKTTGIISIDDCQPDVFKSFINFVYTGKSQTLSNDNVCALYEAADKYQEDQLKAECLSFMKNEISVDNFCSFMVLALKYDEKGLLQNATDLFCSKTKDILQSVEWQTFMREYPTQANELTIKFVDCIAAKNACNGAQIRIKK